MKIRRAVVGFHPDPAKSYSSRELELSSDLAESLDEVILIETRVLFVEDDALVGWSLLFNFVAPTLVNSRGDNVWAIRNGKVPRNLEGLLNDRIRSFDQYNPDMSRIAVPLRSKEQTQGPRQDRDSFQKTLRFVTGCDTVLIGTGNCDFVESRSDLVFGSNFEYASKSLISESPIPLPRWDTAVIQEETQMPTDMDASHIHLLICGGTIDNIDLEDVTANAESQIEGYLKRRVKPYFGFGTQILFMKDSRSVTDDDREKILVAIISSPLTRFVVTHGTFTIAETAQYLRKGLERSPNKTVILVGSMVPLLHGDSDAPFNLGFACSAALFVVGGVWIAFNGRLWDPDDVEKNLGEQRFQRKKTLRLTGSADSSIS